MTCENYKIIEANTAIEYRSILTIPKNINFGLEIELEGVNYDEVKRLCHNQFKSSLVIKTDKSLQQGKNAEIATKVLQNTKETWQLIKKIGKLLNHLNPTYNNCSFQINFDASLLPSNEDKIRFLKLWTLYEDIIYRFSKGEDQSFRESLETYAYPIAYKIKDISNRYDEQLIIELFTNNKRDGVVFKTKPTDLIEIRTPNATNNIILWQNYITTFYYLIKLVTSNKYPKKEIDKYIDQFTRIYLLESYELLREEKAIQFANLIFPNQTDQIYFMKQYIGSINR